MNLLVVGLNHKTASVELREKVAAAVAADALPRALEDLAAVPGVGEAAILSTCNRSEIYCRLIGDGGGIDMGSGVEGEAEGGSAVNSAAKVEGDARAIVQWFARYAAGDDAPKLQLSANLSAKLSAHFYQLSDAEVVRHAFRVAAGLDSMVLGETEIFGQMKAAFQSAVEAGSIGKMLNRLFQRTFAVAKRVRTDTAIGAEPISIAYTGVRLAKQIFHPLGLKQRAALLMGAGETTELVARHLKAQGVSRIIIANRSRANAQRLAEGIGGDGEVITLAFGRADAGAREKLVRHLAEVDIVVSATASAQPIFSREMVAEAVELRRGKSQGKSRGKSQGKSRGQEQAAPLLILDLAVPRDVEDGVKKLRGVHLYNVDDLQSVVENHRESRAEASQQAEAIIADEVEEFMRGMRALEAVPVIRSVRHGLERLQEEEAEKAKRRIRNGEDAEAVAQQLARNLTNKFAHYHTQILKQAHVDGDAELLAAVHKLTKSGQLHD